MSSSEPVAAPADPSGLGYQPALDGIRAIAVVAVLLFHDEWLAFARGGFLGVDVFFVLSGFLITTLLLADHARTGTTVSGRFWIRRIRRLLPAFLIMLLFVAAYTWSTAVPSEARELRRSGLSALVYLSNWQQAYFTTHVSTALAHTWSLSIEEQWYLVWPFGLAALLWLSRGRTWLLGAGVAVLGIGSAALMAFLYDSGEQAHAFFGTDARAWELLAGALLAVVLLHRATRPARSWWARGALEGGALAGLAVTVWAFVVARAGDDDLYPGVRVLVVVGVALLILGALQPGSPLVRRLLSLRPLVWIGLISYGLYLYHVPLFWWMSAARTGLHGGALMLARVLVLFGVATASYLYVENPIRRGARLPVSNRLVLAVTVVGVGVAFLTATFISRSEDLRTLVRANYQEMAATTPPGVQRVLVVGDANAYNLGAQLPSPVDRDGIRGAVAAGCEFASGTPVLGTTAVPEQACQPWREAFREARDAFRPDVVVLMTGTTEMFDREVAGRLVRAGTPEAAEHLRRDLGRLQRIVARDGAPLVLLTVPCQDASVLGRRFAEVRGDPARLAWVNSVWRDFAAAHPAAVRVADLGGVLCPGGDPHAGVGAYPYRPNGVELSPTGAVTVWQWLAPIARAAAAESARSSS